MSGSSPPAPNFEGVSVAPHGADSPKVGGGGATRITFLGTSAVVPAGGGDTSSMVVNGRILIDTGWYSAVKMQLYGLSPLDLEYVILTHCHHDHYIGLPQILFYRAMRRRDRPVMPLLKVIGPAEVVVRVVRLSMGLRHP